MPFRKTEHKFFISVENLFVTEDEIRINGFSTRSMMRSVVFEMKDNVIQINHIIKKLIQLGYIDGEKWKIATKKELSITDKNGKIYDLSQLNSLVFADEGIKVKKHSLKITRIAHILSFKISVHLKTVNSSINNVWW